MLYRRLGQPMEGRARIRHRRRDGGKGVVLVTSGGERVERVRCSRNCCWPRCVKRVNVHHSREHACDTSQRCLRRGRVVRCRRNVCSLRRCSSDGGGLGWRRRSTVLASTGCAVVEVKRRLRRVDDLCRQIQFVQRMRRRCCLWWLLLLRCIGAAVAVSAVQEGARGFFCCNAAVAKNVRMSRAERIVFRNRGGKGVRVFHHLVSRRLLGLRLAQMLRLLWYCRGARCERVHITLFRIRPEMHLRR
jgi:hypothetical protein